MSDPYIERSLVRASDCDLHGRLRMDAFFSLMQECAEHHSDLHGLSHDVLLDRGYFFALARIHVLFHKKVSFNQQIVLTTWTGRANRFFCPRYHSLCLEDGTLLAQSAALWVILDVHSRKLTSPLLLDLPFPDLSSLPDSASLPTHLPVRLPESAIQSKYTPKYSDYDLNGHVNNAHYITWLLDSLPKSVLEQSYIHELTAGYEREIRDEQNIGLFLHQEHSWFSFGVTSEAGKHFIAEGILKEGL